MCSSWATAEPTLVFVSQSNQSRQMEEAGMKVIEIRALKKTFDRTQVLDNVFMTVHHGDIYGFLGPNGSGKTTTLRISLGILSRDAGRVIVLGMDPALKGDRLRQRINILPESHGFYGWMQPEEYLRFFSQLYGLQLTACECRDRLEQVGLAPGNRRPIRTFSRGMKQRLGIARALLNDPEILFLDEPTNGLDPKGRREIHDLFLKLNQEQKTTIIISTHILDDVERLCNRIAILHEGKVRYEGPLRTLVSMKSMSYRFVVEAESKIPAIWNFQGISLVEKKGQRLTCSITGMRPSAAIKFLVEAGVAIVEAEPIKDELEALYLTHTTGGLQ
jgi:ABC-2 type transport system ATP-binding protein